MLPDRARRCACGLALFVGQSDVVDQPGRLANAFHHVIAGIDAKRASDARHQLSGAVVDARLNQHLFDRGGVFLFFEQLKKDGHL